MRLGNAAVGKARVTGLASEQLGAVQLKFGKVSAPVVPLIELTPLVPPLTVVNFGAATESCAEILCAAPLITMPVTSKQTGPLVMGEPGCTVPVAEQT